MQRLPPMLHRKRTARRDDLFRAGPNNLHELRHTWTKRQSRFGRKGRWSPTPTPIQEPAIPRVLERRDVLGLAQTGTGKTAGFVLPMLTLLEHGRARARMPRTLILEPTRELASQVQEASTLRRNHRLNVALLIGGVSFDDQDKIITRGADVLIATPGRLLDHFERGKLLLTGVEILVIDEADRMLDMGFIPDIERIVKLLPFTRQTLFFSATMPPEINGSPIASCIIRSGSRSRSACRRDDPHKVVPSGGSAARKTRYAPRADRRRTGPH